MTLIAAITDRDGIVHMVGDRLTTSQYGDTLTKGFAKIAVLTPDEGKEHVVIGGCGNSELSMLCTQLLTIPPLPEDQSPDAFFRWVLKDFRPRLHALMTEYNFYKKLEFGQEELPGMILMGARGNIVRFAGRIIPTLIQRSSLAMGSGEDCANGALHFALKRENNLPSGMECKEYLLEAVRVATALKSTVGPPFDFINTTGGWDLIEK